MSLNIPTKGHIYLLKLCDTKNRIIYKPGKSINFKQRYKAYYYAEILKFCISDDITKDENEIIKLFNINCKLDKGREFFLAKDDNYVLKLFMNYFNSKINLSNSVNNLVGETIVAKNKVNTTIDYFCPTCKKKFNYASRLKTHLETTIHCKKTTEEIKSFFLQFKKQADFKCNICNSDFTKKQNLQRHINNSNCKIEYEEKEKEREKQIEIIQKKIDELKKQNTQPINKELSSTQINNNNNNEIIINNNPTIKNTIVQHIYPLGYEKLPNISQDEMIRLLELGNEGVIKLIKLVCDQDENKNFYKINMNKNYISFLNNQYKIYICQEKELKKILLNQCIILSYQMLIICSPLLSSDKICSINNNLKNISDKMKIYDNGIKNIIEYELRNNNKITKEKIIKYTKDINENIDIKEQAFLNYNNILQLKENTINSFTLVL